MTGRLDIDLGEAGPVARSRSEREMRTKPGRDTLPMPGRIALLAHCGTGNLGDEASIASIMDNIVSRSPASSVVGVSMDPDDTRRRHGIPCFAMRQTVFPFKREWSVQARPAGRPTIAGKFKALLRKTGPLFRLGNAVRHMLITWPAQLAREILFVGRTLVLLCELDMLVICGGGQLLDWGGPWAFPYTLFKWVLLAKCANVRCVFLNSGAGPLESPLSRWFVRRTLAMSDYVSLRDRASGELLRRIGVGGRMKVVADAVWNLRLPAAAARPAEPRSGHVIGIAPMAYGDASRHWVDDDGSYRRLIANLAMFCGAMLERGCRIKLFSSDIWFDSQAILDLETAIRRDHPALAYNRLSRETVCDFDDLFSALSGLDCYLTCRFHGVVFASLSNVPSIALSPHPKVAHLMEELGLSDYCLDISRCDAADLTARFERLIAEMDGVKARIASRVATFQGELSQQFDELFLEGAETRSGAA